MLGRDIGIERQIELAHAPPPAPVPQQGAQRLTVIGLQRRRRIDQRLPIVLP
jgi:hypothetical protein